MYIIEFLVVVIGRRFETIDCNVVIGCAKPKDFRVVKVGKYKFVRMPCGL